MFKSAHFLNRYPIFNELVVKMIKNRLFFASKIKQIGNQCEMWSNILSTKADRAPEQLDQ